MHASKNLPSRVFFTIWTTAAICCLTPLAAQDFEFLPGAHYNPDIPTLKAVVGHEWGEKISLHHEIERYIQALAQASPNVVLETHGQTWEGKTLYHLIIGSEANLNRLDQIRSGLHRLAFPGDLESGAADGLIRGLPTVVWLAYGVHGNEISSPDAAMLTAYHLAAAQDDEVRDAALRDAIVIIDPMENPDGRDRFINFYRQNRGRWPDADLQSAEHNEGWPGGRTNHYLFDMNRDWFAMTQPETRGRIAAYLQWYPQVVVDLHEMGTNSTYYFAPPADPLNPELTAGQREWLTRFGRNNARWFDRFGFDYFTREVYDSFYPGYGEDWPIFQGSIGMTYEQASVRGLVADRSDDTVIRYRDSVQHHFISSLSTIETAARNRGELLRHFYDYRKSAIAEGSTGDFREVILDPSNDPIETGRLVSRLLKQGIEVHQARSEFSNPQVRDYSSEEFQPRDFPSGTYVIPLAQPAKRLVRVLFDRHIPQGDDFVEKQKKRWEKRQRFEIYDITGWSIPLLTNLDAYRAGQPSPGDFQTLTEISAPEGHLIGGAAQVAYLVPWNSKASARAAAWLFRHDIRVHSADKPFSMPIAGTEREFPAGTLIVKRRDNPENLQQLIGEMAAESGLDAYAANTAWVTSGPNFGSANVQYLKKPRIALAYNQPTNSGSAGATRYLIEQDFGYPVTVLPAEGLGSFDLSKYDVLILPQAFGYQRVLSEGAAGRLRDWVRGGGTLVALGSAVNWLTQEKVGLLSAKIQKREKPESSEEKDEEKGESSYDKEIRPKEESPAPVEGVLVRARIDPEHWMGFGYRGGTNVMVNSNRIFDPLRLDQGTNVAVYASRDKLWLSGFILDESLDQMAETPFLMHQRQGRGNVVAFTEDPSFRAFCDGLHLLLANAIFLGPGH